MTIKAMSRKVFQKCCSFFGNIKNKKRCFISFGLAFVSSLFLLVAGANHSTINCYRSASYFAETIKKDDSIENVAVIVKQKTKDSSMPDTATELRSLYGAFGNRKSNYAGTINANKNHTIKIQDFNIEDNFSFVYVQTGVGVNPSKTNPNHRRMEFYPLDLMFNYYPNNPTKYYSFMYISTIHARCIIDYLFPGLFDSNIPTSELADNETFIKKCEEEILGKGINIGFDGEIKKFQVTNIFYANDYFYQTVYNTIGDFLIGYNQYPNEFYKEATYFLNEYEYQNNFYLKYIKERYGGGDYEFNFKNTMLADGFDYSKGMLFLNEQSSVLFYLFFVFSLILLVASVAMAFYYKINNLTYFFYFVIFILFPYFTGLLLYTMTKNIIFFPPFFTTVLLVQVLILSFFYAIVFVIRKNKENANE